MMGLLLVLFVAGSVVVCALIFFSMLDDEVMPWGCPRCHHPSETDYADRYVRWYRVEDHRVRCRSCGSCFKEHPNGTLVEDR